MTDFQFTIFKTILQKSTVFEIEVYLKIVRQLTD